MNAPTPHEPDCPRCTEGCRWHLLPCERCDCLTSAWHGFPDPETYPLSAT